MGEAARNQGAALAKNEANASITGTFHNARAIDARLAAAQREYHLVSPFTAAGALPEGCGVQITLVQVDTDHETYDVGMGKLGLAKSALDRISHGIGISWDPELSRRLDDGRDPHYVHYRAVGRYRASDGQQQVVMGEKEMDLRESSPQIEALEERAKKKGKSAAAQVREMRLHILGHAETKARLRAIRSMGIRTSYSAGELAKPFACARVVFTGRTEDAELRREFSKMTAASFLGGVTTLYGAPAGQTRVLPAGHAPPPVGSVRDEDDFGGDGYIDAPSQDATPPAAPATPEHPTATATPRERAPRSGGGAVMKFGNARGTPLSEAEDEDLSWYAGALRRSITAPDKANFRARNEADLAEVEAELARRRGEESSPPDDGGDGRTWDDEDFPS